MKMNRFFAAAAAFAMAFSLAACGDKDSPVEIVSDEDRIHVEVDQEIPLRAHTKQSESIKWSCDDDEVAVVSPDGKVTGKSNGIAVITAQTDSGYDHIGLVVGNGVKGTAAVVKDADGNVLTGNQRKTFNGESRITSLRVSLNGMTEDETLILGNDDEAYLKVSVTPADCEDPLDYYSSDPSVAEVDKNGTVYPKSKGSTIITVTAPNGVNDDFKIFVR